MIVVGLPSQAISLNTRARRSLISIASVPAKSSRARMEPSGQRDLLVISYFT